MTAIPQPSSLGAVPERISKPLRDVAARQWKLCAATGALRTLMVALVVVLAAALVLGLLPGLPRWVRIPVAAITWAAVFAAAVRALLPLLRRRSLADAAFTVERHVPGLEERVSSAVELSAESGVFVGSPLLVRHLIRQAESAVQNIHAERLLPAGEVRRRALLLVPPAVLWIALAILIPRPLFAGLYRVLMPWRDQLPTVLATIAVTPGDVTLAETDGLEIRAKVNGAPASATSSERALLLTRDVGAEHAVSRDLEATGAREFKASLADLRQSFSYRVSTNQGDSGWYTATVLPRPAVTRLDLRYDYPAYAGIDPKVQADSDGAIHALQGTEVTLTITTADAPDLGDGRSRITVSEGTRQRDLQLKPVQDKPHVYEAKLTIFNSGSYRIRLMNRHGLSNRDDPPRPIVAEMDQPPKVAITAPASEVTVRPDDDVPVSFTASDDFGIAKLQVMVQVDEKPAEPADIVLPGGVDRRRVESVWPLSVAAHLARSDVADAKRITYWLRATDNRDPDPQSAESAKQTLKIDRGEPLAYRTRLERRQAKDLAQAIDRAIQRLQQAEGPVNSLKDIDRGRPMNGDEKTRAKEQRENLSKTSQDLTDAAESNLRNLFSVVAAKAKEIADSPIRGAAEDVARALLSGADPEPRARAAADAAGQMADARKQLEELKGKVEARSKELEAARELEQLARKQAELARAQTPPAKPDKAEQQRQRERSQQRQRELAERLQRTINETEPLRDAKAAEQAVKLRELLDRIGQIRKDIPPLDEQLAKQQKTAELAAKADDLAAKQQELNKRIEQFAEDRRAALRRADARAPDPPHQAAIVDRLRQNEPQQAQDLQRQSVEQLKHAAKQLEERGRSPEPRPDPAQQYAIDRREQAKQQAQQAAERAAQAAEQLRQAKEAKNPEQLAAAQKAVTDAAQELTDQARAAGAAVKDAASSGDATAEKGAADANRAADAAKAAADAARRAAQQADAAEVVSRLDDAAKQVAKADQQALEATHAQQLAEQQAVSKAAAGQAKELAARQAELADASKATAKALEQARHDQQPPQEVANRQNQLKDKTQEALRQAGQLEQLARPTYPSLADRAAGAEKLLRDAAASEAQAADSEQAAATASRQEGEFEQKGAQANQQAAQLEQQAAQALAQADEQRQAADVALRQADDARARKDDDAAKNAEQQAAQAKQLTTQHQKQAEDLRQQAAAAATKQADAGRRTDAAESSARASRQQSAVQQTRAAQALAKAEGVLRDVDRMTAEAAARHEPSKGEKDTPAAGAEPATVDAEADARQPQGQENQADKSRGGSPTAPMTPEQAMRQAAQGAQEASQAQQQAVNNNADAGAIRQAAAALQQAATAMSAATATGESSESAVAGADEQAETGGDAHSAKDAATASASARSLDSRTGTGTGAGSHEGRPLSVQELGISAGDWARLGPLTRQELLNAAQQSGPPSYREMIKNYYVRIARFGKDETRK